LIHIANFVLSMSKLGKLYLIPNVLAPATQGSILPSSIKEAAEQTKYFFAEEIRTARRFLSELKVSAPIESLRFYEVNKDTSAGQIKDYFSQIPEGSNIGVISEAGCPGIADPGALAVKHAHQIGMRVVPLVGPSSILLALMASGLNGQAFAFHGYIPIEKDARLSTIKYLEKESRQKGQTQIFIETPYRNNKLIEDILNTCHSDTRFCIAANLTAYNEFIKTMSIKEWKMVCPDLHKQPAIFLLSA
jgi:16S rRNA (cytidine1402-2'-O)-methyltransferase